MDTINVRCLETQILISLPTEYRNYCWSKSFGKLQKILRNMPSKVIFVIVDATKCIWIDPLPLLSLIISLSEYSQTKKVCLVIPNISSLTDEKKRVLEFIEKEGFVKCMEKRNICIIQENEMPNFLAGKTFESNPTSIRKWIRKELNGYVYFNNSTIIEASIFDLKKEYNSEEKIHNKIESILERVEHRISKHISGNLTNEIVWKIGFFLKETIDNVLEHAYTQDSPTKFVGFYVRHRLGLCDNSLNPQNREDIKRAIDNEAAELPRLKNDFPKSTTSFIEIFVIDAGMGITTNFVSKRKNIRHSFKEVWRETIGLGGRGEQKRKNTEFGGLYTLGKLLKDDYLLARDYDFWIGDNLPIEKTNASYLQPIENPDDFIEGLALLGRISMKKPMDNDGWISCSDNTQPFLNAIKEERNIYKKYYNKEFSELRNSPFYIKDERFIFNDDVLNEKYFNQKENVEYCIFLPTEHISKNEIFNKINNTILELINIKNNSHSIIIADIPVCECGLYQFAIEKAVFSNDVIERIDTILLISKRLSVRILIKNKNRFIFSHEKTKKYINNNSKDFAPHLSFLHMIEWLKTHDSMLLWRYIKTKSTTDDFFINSNIEWYKENENKTLNGYLDFEKTLTDSFIKNIYYHALERTLCLTKKSACIYTTEDPLMTGLAAYMNSIYYNLNKDESSDTIVLGSVFVSGLTQNKTSNNSIYKINMFLHKGSGEFIFPNTIMHLFTWPIKNSDWLSANNENNGKGKNYRRVGSTYAIAPFGWRYFPIPRFKAKLLNTTEYINNYFFTKEEIKNIEFKSIYNCLPKDTYNYWQGRNGQFVGITHTDYETKHDILKIDFVFIVRESFLLGGELACFILGEFILALGIDTNQVNFHDNEKLSDGVKKYCSKNENKYKDRQCSFIIYPSHVNTEQIIDIIKPYIGENSVKSIIPLIPLNRERNGTCFQPSPLTIEKLKREINSLKIKQDSPISVLLFDDAIVDGKTQEEIKHILYGLGVNQVLSIFILERRRLPFNTSDCKKTTVFWRLDIPRLGTKYNCPLCTSLNYISDFSSQIISYNAQKRIHEWLNEWKAKNGNIQERLLTIMPSKLNLNEKQFTKRFGIYFEDNICKQCGGESNKIELITSLGLTLYMGELLSMTSRDDKMLQYCSPEYSLDDSAKIEMLCTNLLLFGNNISRKIREKITIEIFNSANRISECNNHTSFAALVLITQEKKNLDCLYPICQEMAKSNIELNYDMLILLAYIGSRQDSIFHDIEVTKRLHRNFKSEFELYKKLHSEIFNGDGKAHNTPLQRLNDGAISQISELRKAEDSLDFVAYLLNYIHDWNLTKWNITENSEYFTIKETIELIKNNKNKLMKYSTWDSYYKDRDTVKYNIQNLFRYLYKIHNMLFMPLNLLNKNKNYKKEFVLQDRFMKWRNDDKFDIGLHFNQCNVGQSHIYERWISWDDNVNNEIEYLIINAIDNSGGKFENPIDKENKEEHLVWVSLIYDIENSLLTIMLFNKKNDESINAEDIQQKTSFKQREGKHRLVAELGIKVSYKDYNSDIILTEIQFNLI